MARTNQLMIPQVWRLPEPDVCKTIQHSCLIRLTSANKRVLSLSKMLVPAFCTVPQTKKSFYSAHKGIDKRCKMALIVPNFNVHWVSNLGVRQLSSLRGEARPKIDSHPLGPGIGDRRSPGLSCSRSGWFKAVQENKRKVEKDMRRTSLLFVLVAFLGACQYCRAQSGCSDDTDQEDGGCQKSRCSVSCSGGGGVGLIQSSVPANEPIIRTLHEVEMRIAELKMSTSHGNLKDGLAESKILEQQQVHLPAITAEIFSLDAREFIWRRTL